MPSLAVIELESRASPAVLAAAGGVVYLLDGSGRSFRPFEEGAAAVPVHLVQDGDLIWVGAGPGGGPRLQARDYRSLAVVEDRFVGDPGARTGVAVAAFAPDRSPLRAEPHPSLPGDPRRVQREIDRLPEGVAGWLVSSQYRVWVYGGSAITDLPEFAHLRGVPTPQAGDGSRTYDQVSAVGPPHAAYVSDRLPGPTLHEVGHGVWFRLVAEDRAAWTEVHAGHRWPDPYLGSDPAEAFAEAFAWWARDHRDTAGFFAWLAAARGW
jgi:hypothetical protein